MIPEFLAHIWRAINRYKTFQAVNSGGCEEFAKTFLDFIPGGEIVGTDNMDGWDSKYPGHIWIYDGKLHYDSECLNGTADWRDLPIFKRAEAK
uniref:Uncharacterized protein n=1 Tax=Pseudomonas phage RVTF4 TaxID=3236931 RepID=A0AB39CCT8_9VIRU